ncbi:hypothetical protein ACOYW6_02125 [Parablastomonas sp. CN1-191]|uniref:hypothetical protein n=1 Tax=Parablastomonas sp. CN1-191 TaxID=3400908 RepID=UPI003BF87FC4
MSRQEIGLAALASVILVTFWPWLGNPFNYLYLRDSVRTSIPVAMVLGEPCTTVKGDVTYYDRSSRCYRFDEPKRYQGIWLYEFEGSAFFEGATTAPRKRPSYGSTVWLMYDPVNIDPKLDYDSYDKLRDCYPAHAFEVEFIGSRSPEGHGHLGVFGSEIWVQRMLSAKPIPAPDCKTY